MTTALGLVAAVLAVVLLRRLWARLRLSLAKHPGLVGHPRMARLLARALPAYAFDEDEAFGVDGAPPDVVERRQQSFFALAGRLRARAPRGIDATAALRTRVPDLDLTLRYRVPFAFARLVEAHLPGPRLVTRADGSWLTDLDGRRSLDLSGSYGVDLLGVERYRDLVEEGWAATRDLGLVLGPTHPVMIDNVARLRALSGHDAVSFHMSGTEAVMQAIRLARYHTRRRHLVRFAGAYHGWSSDVQAGPGNPRAVRDVFTLSEMSPRTLAVLRTRSDIAAVLVNPLQALAPNRRPAADAAPLARSRSTVATRDAYAGWLRELREVCDDRGIVLIFDEVFTGFRLAPGGAQAFFGVHADLVVYGKTLGGGLPVGVVCGRADLMKRFRDDRPADLCFARGTFNGLPIVMGTMNAFLRALDTDAVRATYTGLEARWDARRTRLNDALGAISAPLRLDGLISVWTTRVERPSRFNWMFRFYLEDAGLMVPWTGTGRLVFPHSLDDADFDILVERFVGAAQGMLADGWWHPVEGLTHRRIARQWVWETARAALGRRPWSPA